MSAIDPLVQDPDPSASRTRSGRGRAIAVAAGIGLVVIAFAVWWSSKPSRQEVVAERGSMVMPFDLGSTTHVFEPTASGGIQIVVADDPNDAEQISLVREHLAEEAQRFQAGDFGDPATIHGQDMPGLAVLEASAGALTVSYREVPAGGEVTFSSTDPAVVQALHDWFAAQLADHGDHAMPG